MLQLLWFGLIGQPKPQQLPLRLILQILKIICIYVWGTADGGTVVKVTVLQIVWSLVRFQMVSLEFFIDIILPIALWSWG
jgi:hypothetical protein